MVRGITIFRDGKGLGLGFTILRTFCKAILLILCMVGIIKAITGKHHLTLTIPVSSHYHPHLYDLLKKNYGVSLNAISSVVEVEATFCGGTVSSSSLTCLSFCLFCAVCRPSDCPVSPR